MNLFDNYYGHPHQGRISVEKRSEITMTLESPIQKKTVSFDDNNNENVCINNEFHKSVRSKVNDNYSLINNSNLYNNYELTRHANDLYTNQQTNNLMSTNNNNIIISNNNFNTGTVLDAITSTSSIIAGELTKISTDTSESSSHINKIIEELQGATLLLSKDNLDLINLQKQILRANRVVILQNAIIQQYSLIQTFDKKDETSGFFFLTYPEYKCPSLKKRAQFIAGIFTNFLSDKKFEIPSLNYVRASNEVGREEFRNRLSDYIYSVTGSKPRIVHDANKYYLLES